MRGWGRQRRTGRLAPHSERRVPQDFRREIAVARNRHPELDVFWPTERRMLPKRVDAEDKAGMPTAQGSPSAPSDVACGRHDDANGRAPDEWRRGRSGRWAFVGAKAQAA